MNVGREAQIIHTQPQESTIRTLSTYTPKCMTLCVTVVMDSTLRLHVTSLPQVRQGLYAPHSCRKPIFICLKISQLPFILYICIVSPCVQYCKCVCTVCTGGC